MVFKVIFSWFKKRLLDKHVSASQNSVSIGRDNYGPVTIISGAGSDAVVDIKSILEIQCRRQLDYEKSSGKYIPDVFIETRETKNLARTFSHPLLFYRRTLDSLARINIPSKNRFLQKAGLPELPFPNLHDFNSRKTLDDVSAAAIKLLDKLAETTSVLSVYEKSSSRALPPFPIKAGCEPFYEQNSYHLQMLGWGLKDRLDTHLNELNAARARILILTGRAGQGKTNLVCDFVDNFLLKHEIPCAYLSVRRLSSISSSELGDAVHKLIFDGATSSFSDAAKRLSAYATGINKPFVLVIDGLNEHHRISEFSAQLEHFIHTVIEYPHLKLLLTCRSEFFRQRFGNLLKAPLTAHTFLVEAHEHRRDKERYDEMLSGYFDFFKVDRELVSEQVIESLKSDILLLRFFCEAYGAKNQVGDYKQPYINNIYREHIFKKYLEEKLGTANLFMQRIVGAADPNGRSPALAAVLECAVKHMLETWQFSDVPINAFPVNLNEALYALLNEELVIRRDAPTGPSIFSPNEETINFTFDEFRDYLLAQYLLYRVFKNDEKAFMQYIARNDPKDIQTIEGIKRFLFYASRHKENEKFWFFYRKQTWYSDVYNSEVFNIDPELLQEDDRDLIVGILRKGGERARNVARILAVRWHVGYYPILNIDLLVSYISMADDAQYDLLLRQTFKTIPDFHNGTSASAFCKFVTSKILPKLTPIPDGIETGIFDFLTLLLPVDSTANLESDSMSVFRELIRLYPDYALSHLRRSIDFTPTQHKPYVWRLLATYSHRLSENDPLVSEARKIQTQSKLENRALLQEVNRFLAQIYPTGPSLLS